MVGVGGSNPLGRTRHKKARLVRAFLCLVFADRRVSRLFCKNSGTNASANDNSSNGTNNKCISGAGDDNLPSLEPRANLCIIAKVKVTNTK